MYVKITAYNHANFRTHLTFCFLLWRQHHYSYNQVEETRFKVKSFVKDSTISIVLKISTCMYSVRQARKK